MIVDWLFPESYIFPKKHNISVFLYKYTKNLNISYIVPPKYQFLLYFFYFQILYFVWGPLHPLCVYYFKQIKSLAPDS